VAVTGVLSAGAAAPGAAAAAAPVGAAAADLEDKIFLGPITSSIIIKTREEVHAPHVSQAKAEHTLTASLRELAVHQASPAKK